MDEIEQSEVTIEQSEVTIKQSEVTQKEKHQDSILMHIYGI